MKAHPYSISFKHFLLLPFFYLRLSLKIWSLASFIDGSFLPDFYFALLLCKIVLAIVCPGDFRS